MVDKSHILSIKVTVLYWTRFIKNTYSILKCGFFWYNKTQIKLFQLKKPYVDWLKLAAVEMAVKIGQNGHCALLKAFFFQPVCHIIHSGSTFMRFCAHLAPPVWLFWAIFWLRDSQSLVSRYISAGVAQKNGTDIINHLMSLYCAMYSSTKCTKSNCWNVYISTYWIPYARH